ncbi:hypothetical protein Psuf_004150 [Phytohabitans suffuscus]|uniref:Gamma-glutamyltransferase n=1 Tax=Phytohabitans suffuscus TaxID=624315 RepID=A0A6F8YAG0_9ACTN|nr:gamma-glutamyltransferase [Phytohabitans suffuscus]BCB83102.1 hypothetical protein Psuf_004150 [Phytohabitans suffuscus]
MNWHVPNPTVLGTRHAVSSGHYLASSAALAILDAGGNAVDAGCCAGMALAVLHADEVNFAGVAPIMIRLADGTTVSIDGLGVWPAGIPADLFLREHGGVIPSGLLRTVVPAAPDAWITALREHGTMTFGQVAAAAIRLARDGFPAHPLLVAGITSRQRGYRNWPANEAIYLPGGRPPEVGERFVQADLARSIQLMADAEAATAGGREAGLEAARAVFYEGELAERMVAYHRENGGYLTAADLAGFRSRYEPVVTVRWRDFEVMTCGPWSQGPALAQALRTLEAYGLDGLAHNSPAYVHLVVEALKGVFSDREHLYGDPAFVDVDVQRLVSDAHAAARAARIDPERAHPGCRTSSSAYRSRCPSPRTTTSCRSSARARPRTSAWSTPGATRSPRHRRTAPPPRRSSPGPASCRRCAACSPGPTRPTPAASRPASGPGSRPTRRSRSATTGRCCRSAAPGATCRYRRCSRSS